MQLTRLSIFIVTEITVPDFKILTESVTLVTCFYTAAKSKKGEKFLISKVVNI